ncbi:ParA family protein [Bdellovibrionota bacterium FG-2]
MASFKNLHFTPAEFTNTAKVNKHLFSELENEGLIRTVRKRIGNVDRKMVTLEDMQNYFRILRANPDIFSSDAAPGSTVAAEDSTGRHGDQTENHDAAASTSPPVAAATRFIPQPPKNKIQMLYNVKGGTGKSTLAAQYAMRASMLGLNVLAIDLDGQGHLTVNLDILDAHERPTIYDVLINDLPIANAVMNVAPGLDLIPANLGLCNIEIPLNNKPRREYRLSEAIKKIAHNYDLIIADTNPAASILNSSMLVATNLVNVVCATNPLSFHGMSLVMATIEGMEREFGHELQVKIIPNMYDNREVISQEVLGELRSQFSEFCTKAVVNRSADLNEATKRRTSVWDVSTKGVAAQDINSLTEELILN